MTYQVYNQSCIDGMREHVADGSVDLIFTDPPYGIDGDGLDVHYHRDESNVIQGYIDVPLTQYAKFSQEWISECARVLRPGGSLYIEHQEQVCIQSLPCVVLAKARQERPEAHIQLQLEVH